MKAFATLLIILFSFSLLQAQDLSRFLKAEFISSEYDTLNYRVLYPKNYKEDKSYPTLLFLHGGGERGNDNEAQLTHGTKLFLENEIPVIIIAPQCPADSYWSSVNIDRTNYPVSLDFDYSRNATPPLKSAIELVKSFVKSGKTDKTQLYIMGMSMGGMGTFEAVYRNPGLFKAAIPICGAADLNTYNEKTNNVPFWIFHGEIDGVIRVENSRNAFAKLKELGNDVIYTEYPNVNHNSWDNVFAEPNLFQWLFSH